jgi:3-hydroxymyristoyl/3-hydroxydecanoyl-(acyl carrier protein) dehydratase
MPGVLIVEAMAQLAGLMLTQWQESGHVAMIVSLNNIKLRRQVIPGDQLILESIATRLKARTAVIETTAKVGDELAAEAQLRLVLVDPDGGTNDDG